MFGQPQPPMPEQAGQSPAGEQDMKPMIIQAARQLQKLAAQHGIDLMAVLSEGGGGEAGAPPMPPAPPPM